MNHAIRRGRPIRARLAVILAALVVATLAPFGAPVMAVEPPEEELVMTTELFRENGYGMHFGQDVAIEGDTMVVGAHIADDNRLGNCGRGVAHVYERVDALEWREIARLTHSEPNECDTFGYIAFTVALHGDWIAVGAPLMQISLPDADDYDPVQGAVLMYHKPEGGWADSTETLRLNEYDGGAVKNGEDYPGFGADVAFDGEHLVIGAPGFDYGDVNDAGAVFVYREWLGGWEPAATLRAAEAVPTLHFGASVAASDGAIAVGTDGPWYAEGYIAHGAWVFERPVEGWGDTDIASATFGMDGALSYQVALDGPTLLVSSIIGRETFVVERGLDGWVGALEPSAELDLPVVPYDSGSDIPWGIAVEGNTIVVGAPWAEQEAGEAFVYHRPADGWGEPGGGAIVQPNETLHQPNPNRASGFIPGDLFGWSVAIEDGIVAVGARGRWHRTFDTGENNALGGSIFAFEPSTDHESPQVAFVLEPAEPTGLNGWYDEPLTLAVEATDAGTGVGRVRCALVTGGSFASYDALPDGPCPYLDGASIPEGEWILFAASVDAAGNRGPVVSQVLKVDDTDPTPVIELAPGEPTGPDGAWLPPFYVKVDSIEEGTVRASGWCTLDPAIAPTTYEELRAMPFCGNDFWSETGREYTVDETHTLWVGAIDRAGNTSELISQTYSVVSRPRVSIGLSSATPPTAGWYRDPVTVTVTGTSANGQPAPDVRCVLDPAIAPPFYDNLPASCPFASGGTVATAGSHVVYAASHDAGGSSPVASATFRIDATPPSLTCQGTGPAQFTIGESDGTLTATVSDAGSGPSVTSASATLDADDLDAVGSFTAQVTATDVAGNEGTAACAYTVGYGIAIVSPTPGAAYKAGATVPLTFRLVDADGDPIADASATSLLGGKKGATCRIAISLDDAALRGCPTYSATTDLFTFGVKTPKSRSAVGVHDIGVEVRASSGTVLSFARVAFLLT